MANDKPNNPLDSAREAADQQVGQIIDQFAHKVPGGEQYKEQAKEAASNALESLQHSAEQQLGGQTMDAAHGFAEQQVSNAIDQYADKLPGGAQYKDKAKEAASGILDSLQQQAEQRMGNLGGLFGGGDKKEE